MKGLILVDIKESCRECPAYDELCIYCNAKGRNTSEFVIPDWCPIKPIAKQKSAWTPVTDYNGKKVTELINMIINMCEHSKYVEGWNDCIKYILNGGK